MAPRVVGDPERIVNQVIEETRQDIEKRIAEALEAARSVLEKAYDEALRELEKALDESLRGLEERLRSAEATKEVELRRELAKLRARYVDEVLQEALEKLHDYVPRDRYEAFLARLMEDAKKKLGGKKAKVIPTERDRELVARLTKRYGFELGGETTSGHGGFLVEAEDGTVLDFTLDNVLSDVIDKARSLIAEELFK